MSSAAPCVAGALGDGRYGSRSGFATTGAVKSYADEREAALGDRPVVVRAVREVTSPKFTCSAHGDEHD